MRSSLVWLALFVFSLAGCGGAKPPPPTEAPKSTLTIAAPDNDPGHIVAGARAGFPAEDWGGASVASGDAIPVTPADPTWGNPNAPVTLVEFADLECLYCAKAAVTLSALREIYGPEKLRIVWKHDPLPFHSHARQAADLGAGIFRVGGNEAFFTYVETLYANYLERGNKSDFSVLAVTSAATAAERIPGQLGGRALMDAAQGPGAQKVDDDLALVEKLGVKGTPAFFINGILISGAQPVDAFKTVIDEELRATQAQAAQGTPTSRMYADRLAQNVKAGRGERTDGPGPKRPEVADTAIWRVPVGTSPSRGKANAPVTLVVFGDFQCPFCKKANATVEQVRAKYVDKVRVVFKHNPLPFHERAAPSAELAIEAYKKKGNDAFWKVHDSLFGRDVQHLQDQDLEELGKDVGLDPKTVASAISTKKHASVIDEDQALAGDVEANATPIFFINGRKLVGAQPIEKFSALIDEQLAIAEAKIKAGTPAGGVYDALMKDAKTEPEPETKTAPKVSKDSPSRGPAGAKVTLQIFSDFQCPFCKKVEPTIAELEKAFPGQIRVVWRNRPLSMHPDAESAAEAAMEARTQMGDVGFWKMHELLFADQKALDSQGLEDKAQKLGLDMAKFRAALARSAHRAEIDADSKIADGLSIDGTPSVLVNDYFVGGAEQLSVFKRVVRLALRKKK